eukprot:TRINITY_DN3136_c1_g4_i1.p1 TRINITY_DN3136_c1_g4~~TRINITY_DN3136_c1_g4_i1.p1  ORF type:complete len:1601 (-),score=326.33 TRINITY_DN3136_c1_g4_i1:104-4906(-)
MVVDAMWVELKTEDGRTYFWNRRKNVRAWVLPEGSTVKWVGQKSSDGRTYYWSRDTKETVWVLPPLPEGTDDVGGNAATATSASGEAGDSCTVPLAGTATAADTSVGVAAAGSDASGSLAAGTTSTISANGAGFDDAPQPQVAAVPVSADAEPAEGQSKATEILEDPAAAVALVAQEEEEPPLLCQFPEIEPPGPRGDSASAVAARHVVTMSNCDSWFHKLPNGDWEEVVRFWPPPEELKVKAPRLRRPKPDPYGIRELVLRCQRHEEMVRAFLAAQFGSTARYSPAKYPCPKAMDWCFWTSDGRQMVVNADAPSDGKLAGAPLVKRSPPEGERWRLLRSALRTGFASIFKAKRLRRLERALKRADKVLVQDLLDELGTDIPEKLQKAGQKLVAPPAKQPPPVVSTPMVGTAPSGINSLSKAGAAAAAAPVPSAGIHTSTSTAPFVKGGSCVASFSPPAYGVQPQCTSTTRPGLMPAGSVGALLPHGASFSHTPPPARAVDLVTGMTQMAFGLTPPGGRGLLGSGSPHTFGHSVSPLAGPPPAGAPPASAAGTVAFNPRGQEKAVPAPGHGPLTFGPPPGQPPASSQVPPPGKGPPPVGVPSLAGPPPSACSQPSFSPAPVFSSGNPLPLDAVSKSASLLDQGSSTCFAKSGSPFAKSNLLHAPAQSSSAPVGVETFAKASSAPHPLEGFGKGMPSTPPNMQLAPSSTSPNNASTGPAVSCGTSQGFMTSPAAMPSQVPGGNLPFVTKQPPPAPIQQMSSGMVAGASPQSNVSCGCTPSATPLAAVSAPPAPVPAPVSAQAPVPAPASAPTAPPPGPAGMMSMMFPGLVAATCGGLLPGNLFPNIAAGAMLQHPPPPTRPPPPFDAASPMPGPVGLPPPTKSPPAWKAPPATGPGSNFTGGSAVLSQDTSPNSGPDVCGTVAPATSVTNSEGGGVGNSALVPPGGAIEEGKRSSGEASAEAAPWAARKRRRGRAGDEGGAAAPPLDNQVSDAVALALASGSAPTRGLAENQAALAKASVTTPASSLDARTAPPPSPQATAAALVAVTALGAAAAAAAVAAAGAQSGGTATPALAATNSQTTTGGAVAGAGAAPVGALVAAAGTVAGSPPAATVREPKRATSDRAAAERIASRARVAATAERLASASRSDGATGGAAAADERLRRKVIVSNIPPLAKATELADFFTGAIFSATGHTLAAQWQSGEASKVVVGVDLLPGSSFGATAAEVTFGTPTGAMVAVALHGIQFSGKTLEIRRPKGFSTESGKARTKLQGVSIKDLVVGGFADGKVANAGDSGGVDVATNSGTPNTAGGESSIGGEQRSSEGNAEANSKSSLVRLSGIPTSMNSKSVFDLLQQFGGPLKSLNLATKKETGDHLGHGTAEYVDRSSAIEAVGFSPLLGFIEVKLAPAADEASAAAAVATEQPSDAPAPASKRQRRTRFDPAPEDASLEPFLPALQQRDRQRQQGQEPKRDASASKPATAAPATDDGLDLGPFEAVLPPGGAKAEDDLGPFEAVLGSFRPDVSAPSAVLPSDDLGPFEAVLPPAKAPSSTVAATDDLDEFGPFKDAIANRKPPEKSKDDHASFDGGVRSFTEQGVGRTST